MTFIHGGQLEKIKQQYPKQTLPWVDLSTGISPFSYPIQAKEKTCAVSLPQHHQALKHAAAHYYGSEHLVITPGSMWGIQTLPLIRRLRHSDDTRPVLLPKQGFNEHKKAWLNWGFKVETYDKQPSPSQLVSAQVCIVINPNNPTGQIFQPTQLTKFYQALSINNGDLIVDEAFLDVHPELSMAAETDKPNLIILKSFGKYFGLPGLRVGALIAHPSVLDIANRLLNEWSISSVAQATAIDAWLDIRWHALHNRKLKTAGERLQALLAKVGIVTQGTVFFQTHYCSHAKSLYEYLLNQAIYVRLLDDESGVRIALPKRESEWTRLETALLAFTRANPLPKTNSLTQYKKAEPA